MLAVRPAETETGSRVGAGGGNRGSSTGAVHARATSNLRLAAHHRALRALAGSRGQSRERPQTAAAKTPPAREARKSCSRRAPGLEPGHQGLQLVDLFPREPLRVGQVRHDGRYGAVEGLFHEPLDRPAQELRGAEGGAVTIDPLRLAPFEMPLASQALHHRQHGGAGKGPLGPEALDAEARCAEALAASRHQDAESGTTAIGPHRSDLLVRDGATGQAARECSTGQQKALLVSIVLAEARLRAAEGGRMPILLLDEVAAHLDGQRRADLFEELVGLGTQAWLAGTDAATFAPLRERAQMFTVRGSSLIRL